MKMFYKGLMRIAAGAFLAAVLMAAYSGLTGGWNTTDPYRVGGADIVKTMTFKIDSLGTPAETVAVFTCPRGITLKSASVYATTVFTGYAIADSGDAQIWVKSGATQFTARVDSAVDYQNTDPTDVSFAAAAVCTLIVYDDAPGGTDGNGTGGLKAWLTLWYTDD